MSGGNVFSAGQAALVEVVHLRTDPANPLGQKK